MSMLEIPEQDVEEPVWRNSCVNSTLERIGEHLGSDHCLDLTLAEHMGSGYQLYPMTGWKQWEVLD